MAVDVVFGLSVFAGWKAGRLVVWFFFSFLFIFFFFFRSWRLEEVGDAR